MQRGKETGEKMNKLYYFWGECLAEGSVIIPNIIFSSLIHYRYGNNMIFLPFILMYSFQKAGTFAIQWFGEITNPYPILKYGLYCSLLGSLICCFGNKYPICWSIGGVLVGIGLSNYASLFRSLRDMLSEQGHYAKNLNLFGGYFILVGSICFVSFYSILAYNVIGIFVVFLFMQLAALKGIFTFPLWNDALRKKDIFQKKQKRWLEILPFICILFVTFFIRLLKQTSHPKNLIYSSLFLCVLILYGIFIKKKEWKYYSIDTIWLGFVRNFIVIYSLIYFSVLGNISMVGLTYIMLALGIVTSIWIRSSLRQNRSTKKRENIYTAGICVGLLCFLYHPLYFISVYVTALSLSMKNSILLTAFLENPDIPYFERRIVRLKSYNLGAVLQQIVLLTVLLSVSQVLRADQCVVLQSYATFSHSTAFEQIFFDTKLICILLIIFIGMALMFYQNRSGKSMSGRISHLID